MTMRLSVVREQLASAKGPGADATRAAIEIAQQDHRLLLRVTDDGAGRARLVAGGGLAGLAARVRSADGTLTVDSPQGGPTTVTATLPFRV